MKEFLIIILLIVSLLLLFLLIQSIVLKRSFFSSLVELYLFITSKRKWHARFPKTFKRYLKKHNKENRFYLAKKKYKSNVKEYDYLNTQIISFTNKKDVDKVIVYLHGAAYISKPTSHHIRFVDKMAKDTSSIVLFVIYPKLCNNTYKQSFKLLKQLYNDILMQTKKPIIFIGDSSGGGLALSFNLYLIKENIITPNKTILFSPWLDISMSNNKIKEYEHKDCMLSIKPLKQLASLWADDLALNDYKVSPFFEDPTGLDNIYIFVGKREILYPETICYYNKLLQYNINCELIIDKTQGHVYVLYPTKEANHAYQKIINIIK